MLRARAMRAALARCMCACVCVCCAAGARDHAAVFVRPLCRWRAGMSAGKACLCACVCVRAGVWPRRIIAPARRAGPTVPSRAPARAKNAPITAIPFVSTTPATSAPIYAAWHRRARSARATSRTFLRTQRASHDPRRRGPCQGRSRIEHALWLSLTVEVCRTAHQCPPRLTRPHPCHCGHGAALRRRLIAGASGRGGHTRNPHKVFFMVGRPAQTCECSSQLGGSTPNNVLAGSKPGLGRDRVPRDAPTLTIDPRPGIAPTACLCTLLALDVDLRRRFRKRSRGPPVSALVIALWLFRCFRQRTREPTPNESDAG